MMKGKSFLRFSFKKFVAVGLSCMMFLQCSNLSFAGDNQSNVKQLCIKGVNYTITESTDSNGNKNVLVSGGGEKASVVNDGNTLKLTSVKNGVSKCMNIPIDKCQNKKADPANSDVSRCDLFWNYSYDYDTDVRPDTGMWWFLRSGDDNGSWSGCDYNKSLVRDYAYEFCSNVRNLDNKECNAAAVSGAYAGAIAAAIAAAGPTAGVSAIVAVVAAILGGIEIASAWVEAYNASLDCNQTFIRLKQSL